VAADDPMGMTCEHLIKRLLAVEAYPRKTLDKALALQLASR